MHSTHQKKGGTLWPFDGSSGRQKALKLALENNVKFKYQVNDVLDFETYQQFDVLSLIYAHFPNKIRKEANQHLLKFLKPNGKVIFEAFAKEQLGNAYGGPNTPEMLFSIEEIKEEFLGLKFKMLEQQKIQLDEGNRYKGEAEVIRFVAQSTNG